MQTCRKDTDGRFVAFVSGSAVVPEDGNFHFDVFVRDRVVGTTERVSVGSGGIEANGASGCPSLSAEGRYVAFRSSASNLVPGDTNNVSDVFVHDRLSHTTQRVSVDSAGTQGNDASTAPRISGNGRVVAFASVATNLVEGDGNGAADIFVRELQAGTTLRVDTAVNGAQGSLGASGRQPDVDDSGRYVAFVSASPNLVAGDTNNVSDTFVKDLLTGMVWRTSLASGGAQTLGPEGGMSTAISANGRVAAFEARAADFVPDDSNKVADVFVRELPRYPYEYAAKVVCGTQANAEDLRLAPGLYATTVNIHAPTAGTEFFKKLALTAPPTGQIPGRIYPMAQHALQYDQALAVSCNELRREVFGGRFPASFVEGFLVVQSTASIDVTAVYSSAAIDARGLPTAHSSIDVRRVDERRRQARLEVSKTGRYFCNALPVANECTIVAALYTIVVRNDGEVPAADLVIDDTVLRSDGLPLAVALAAPHDVPPGAAFALTGPASVRVQMAELAPGQQAQVRFWALAVIGPGHMPDELINRVEARAGNAAGVAALVQQGFD